jgi:hypothetical protein
VGLVRAAAINTTYIAVAAVVLVLLLRCQLSARPVREKPVVAVTLVVVGLAASALFFSQHQVGPSDVALMVLSLLIGAGLAAVRAVFTFHIWSQDGRLMRQGNVLTALLWVAGLSQHLLIDKLVMPGAGTATILLYFGIVRMVQRVVLLARARSGSARAMR